MKKRSKRELIEFSVKYMLENDLTTIFESSLSKNISVGGFCLQTYKKVDIGSDITIRFFLSNMNRYTEAKVRVIWVKEKIKDSDYEIGIEFLDENAELFKSINNIIDKD